MKKYIDLEFCYTDSKPVYMVYTGKEKANGLNCAKCDKKITGNAHFFTGSEYGEEWVFGSECVKYVFGAGIGN
jgi:hypothetical protein